MTETEDGTVYSLTRDAVLEWGEPCNQKLFPYSWEDVQAAMGPDAGKWEAAEKGDILTVTDEGYGSLDTYFMESRNYILPEGFRVCVRSDMVSGNLYTVMLTQLDGAIEEMYAPAEKLAVAVFGIGEDYAEEITASLKGAYDENAEGIRDGDGISWCTVENEEQVIAWRYDEGYGYSLVYRLNG